MKVKFLLNLFFLYISILGCEEGVFEHGHELPEHSHSSGEHRHIELYEAIHRIDGINNLREMLEDIKQHDNERLHIGRRFFVTLEVYEVDKSKSIIKGVEYTNDRILGIVSLYMKYPREWNLHIKEIFKIRSIHNLHIKVTDINYKENLIHCDIIKEQHPELFD